MRLSTILIHAVLAVTCVPFIHTLAASPLSTSVNVGVNVSISAPLGKNNNWEVISFPKSIMELTKPLRLAKKLVPGTDPFDIVSDPIVKKSKGRVLRSLYPANSYARSGDRHAQFTSTPLPKGAFAGSKSPFIRLEYQMLFQPGFKWVLGGKLPGILVGTESGCNGACSGGGSAENCFSTRMMWRAQGEGELYLYAAKSVYFPKEKPDRCSRSLDKRSPEALFNLEQKQINTYAIPSDDEYEYYNETSSMNTRGFHTSADSSKSSCLNGIKLKITPGSRNMCNPVYGISIGRGGSFKFKSGVWHNVTQIVRINSKGNAVRDGYLAVYLDGKPVVQAENLVLLKKGYNSNKSATSHDVKFMFSSFFGGATKQYATPTAQWIAWKGFKMTTSVKNVWK